MWYMSWAFQVELTLALAYLASYPYPCLFFFLQMQIKFAHHLHFSVCEKLLGYLQMLDRLNGEYNQIAHFLQTML